MAIDIFKTKTMLSAVEQMEPVHSFLRDRYFPTGEGDLFPSDEVLVEYKTSGAHKMAPVVINGHDGVTVDRKGYASFRMEPPLVAPKRALTEDTLKKKGFGEEIISGKTPAQRQAALLAQDLFELDELHTNREEYMAAQCLFNNGYVLQQWADEYGTAGKSKDYVMKFYKEVTNPAVYAPGTLWSATGSDKMADLLIMIQMLTRAGNKASDVLLGADAADALMSDATIQKLLDINNFEAGRIAPELTADGAALLGILNVRGHKINLISYDGQYEDETTGALAPYVPAKSICVTAPGAGRTLYGCVTQTEQADGEFHSYMGRRVPRYWSDKSGRELRLASKPLLIPRTKNPFITAEVL